MKRLPCGEYKDPEPDTCRYLYGSENTPCSKCYPQVHNYNHDILDLYSLVGDQFIMGFAGPVGLNLIAVGYVLDNLYEQVDDKRYFIERLKAFVSIKLERMQETMDDGKSST